MDLQKFQRIVEKSRYVLLPKVQTPHGNVLLAERKFPLFGQHPEHFTPHYQILWAVERDGVNTAQAIFCKITSTRDNRVALAVDTATDWIKDNLEAGVFRA